MDGQVVALCQFKMCQQRLRMTQSMGTEFVARGLWSNFLACPSYSHHDTITAGRIWWVHIYYLRPQEDWRLAIGLSRHSLPARPEAVILSVAAQNERPGCATRGAVRGECQLAPYTLLVPEG
jgi:hypothetical protein